MAGVLGMLSPLELGQKSSDEKGYLRGFRARLPQLQKLPCGYLTSKLLCIALTWGAFEKAYGTNGPGSQQSLLKIDVHIEVVRVACVADEE